ncbi:MAG: dTDP-4-dehydrorhamnose reductase [Rehaibacterium terrae]|uniref:dTDP-4-dehydrorhamnose reductase n=1 Tax=Pseudomonadati TaxID=3379134 RepID=UPI003919A3AD
MRSLITGARGQLAKEFKRYLVSKNIGDILALTKDELDISNFERVMEVVNGFSPSIIINCAAYNLVDRAESYPHEAIRVNTLGVYNLVLASLKTKALLIHFSTDYVFDGKKAGLYTEDDQPNPINEYGKSKLFGENIIRSSLENYLIFRVSWLYGEGESNFLYKLSQWAKSQEYLRVACDEFSVPTSTRLVVEITLKAIKEGLNGLYHLTNSDYCSRYELAKEYFRLVNMKKFIYPAYQADFNLPAKRPRFSAMSNEKISKILNVQIPTWKEELESFIKGRSL